MVTSKLTCYETRVTHAHGLPHQVVLITRAMRSTADTRTQVRGQELTVRAMRFCGTAAGAAIDAVMTGSSIEAGEFFTFV